MVDECLSIIFLCGKVNVQSAFTVTHFWRVNNQIAYVTVVEIIMGTF